MLTSLDEELDRMLWEWRETLLQNLSDLTVQERLSLLRTPQKKLIDEFLTTREFPDPLTQAFVTAAREALSGLQKVVLKLDDLRAAFLSGGLPCTVDEAKRRFEEYLSELVKGKEMGKVRIILE
ncbi:MAG: hypothetical protein GTN93_14855 [Anaerolineae bacterium]|nr:hypothetical protein [Anaerolineae bacterium]